MIRLVLVFALTCLACTSAVAVTPISPQIPREHFEFSPPEIYRTWYVDVAACAGVETKDFHALVWHIVPGTGWNWNVEGVGLIGLFVPPRDIYVSEAFTFTSFVPKHEMLHALGFMNHPEPPFGDCEYR